MDALRLLRQAYLPAEPENAVPELLASVVVEELVGEALLEDKLHGSITFTPCKPLIKGL